MSSLSFPPKVTHTHSKENMEQPATQLKPLPVAQCFNVLRCMSSADGYRNQAGGGGYIQAIDLQTVRYAYAKLQEAIEKDRALHENNKLALEQNKLIADRWKQCASSLGIPPSYYAPDPTSRARIPKSILCSSGWVMDLERMVKLSDGFESAERRHTSLLESYREFERKAIVKQRAEDQLEKHQAEALIRKRKADIEIALVIDRYQLDLSSDWEDILDVLCQKDQLLNLAIAMEMTRNDWSDGPSRVLDALFHPTTPTEKAIIDEVSELCEDFDDGRVFRDCKWNYNTLYNTITNQQLVQDAMLALSHTQND